MIKTKGLTKKFSRNEKEFYTLKDVSLHVGKGEFVGIAGHSGSGKTTFFNMIAGLTKPTSGKIYINDKEITAMSENELAECRNKDVGYILQGSSLLNTFTVLDNVCMPAYLASSYEKKREHARKLLKEMGIEHLENEFPEFLSGGERKRVSIARAMLNEPLVILADEPTSNLDMENSKKVMELLKQISEQGTTVLVSTQELEWLKYTDYAMEMEDGVLKHYR